MITETAPYACFVWWLCVVIVCVYTVVWKSRRQNTILNYYLLCVDFRSLNCFRVALLLLCSIHSGTIRQREEKSPRRAYTRHSARSMSKIWKKKERKRENNENKIGVKKKIKHSRWINTYNKCPSWIYIVVFI